MAAPYLPASLTRLLLPLVPVALVAAAGACSDDGGSDANRGLGGGFVPTPGAGTGGTDGGGESGPPPSTCTCNPNGNYPLGSRPVPYPGGTTVPSVGAETMDQQLGAYYDTWKAQRLKEACGGITVTTPDAPDSAAGVPPLTVSEAQGYGMLIVAMMAGHDPDAQATFDGLVDFYITNRSGALMDWRVYDDCSKESQNATDGDMDIGYALLLADRQWGSNCGGKHDYLALARQIVGAMDTFNVVKQGANAWLRLGDWAGPGSGFQNVTRSSDFMPDHLRAYDTVVTKPSWGQVIDTTYGIFTGIQQEVSTSTGLLPDFILVDPTTGAGTVPTGQVLEGDRDQHFSWNAFRFPLRVAVDYMMNGDARGLEVVQSVDAWASTVTGGDPSEITDGYDLQGTPIVGYNGSSFLAPFGAAAVAAGNQAWADAVWAESLDPGNGQVYFGPTVRLMSLLAMSGNWWSPAVLTCPAPEATAAE